VRLVVPEKKSGYSEINSQNGAWGARRRQAKGLENPGLAATFGVFVILA
jgi:hypothetical protein